MLDFDLLTFCYGCGACVNSCPQTTIRMVQASDGSYIPEIDDRKCIQCGKCDRVCINLHSDRYHTQIAQEGCYAAYQLNTDKREKSASGGMFLPLAMEVLNQGGYVCGCVWSEDLTAVHIVSNKVTDIERMCNSKYVQSDIGYCFTEIQGLLKAGKSVLFCGTPCQCAACEAQAIGKPVIATDAGGLPENIIDGETGFVCQMKNEVALAESIMKIVNMDSSTYEKMSKAASDNAEKKFCATNYVEKLIGIYRSLCRNEEL